MTDEKEPCDEMTCKDDLMQGLMALLAQAEAAETTDADTSQED